MSRVYDRWEKLVGAVLRREKDRQLAYCESITTSSSVDFSSRPSFASDVPADDDSSTTTVDIFRRSTFEWLKGEFLVHGSLGSVYEGINVDGFFFSVEEVSLLDQGDEGKQHISQLRQDESHLHIFHELVSKGSLMRLYQKYTLGDSQVSSYTRQILHGLKYLHDMNVVHRNIKCANILLDTNGSVKLADFGLAKATEFCDLSCMGSVFWMAPEVPGAGDGDTGLQQIYGALGALCWRCSPEVFHTLILKLSLNRMKMDQESEVCLCRFSAVLELNNYSVIYTSRPCTR